MFYPPQRSERVSEWVSEWVCAASGKTEKCLINRNCGRTRGDEEDGKEAWESVPEWEGKQSLGGFVLQYFPSKMAACILSVSEKDLQASSQEWLLPCASYV